MIHRCLISIAITAGALMAQGIYVGSPKPYDNSSLQAMLNAARARLAALEVMNSTLVQGRIGQFSGATMSYSGVAVNVGGPPLAQLATTSKGATSTKIDAHDEDKSQTTTTTPSTDVVTTRAAQNAPTATAAAPGSTMPTGIGVSSGDVVNEMIQLTLQIANLQLMLEGSPADRIVRGTNLPMQRVTLGFPVSITPSKEHKDAVAVVEITVRNPVAALFEQQAGEAVPPTVTMLLPREDSRNVASITDRSASIGGGFVTQAISAGGSVLWGRRTFYAVQDQDTVASLIPAPDGQSAKFGWHFRPVLGRKTVREGLRQLFVQLALPIIEGQGCQGQVTIETYWRKYDKGSQLMKDEIPGTRTPLPPSTIRRYDLTPLVRGTSWEDAGDGAVLVRVDGEFTAGTYVRIGTRLLSLATADITIEDAGLRFAAKAIDLVRNPPVIVGRDGAEVQILNPLDQPPRAPLNLYCPIPPPAVVLPPAPLPAFTPPSPLNITSAKATTADDSNMRLEVAVAMDAQIQAEMREKVLLHLGSQVFGVFGSPLERNCTLSDCKYVAKVPASVLAAAKEVRVVPLLFSTRRVARRTIEGIGATGSADKLVLLSQSGEKAVFLLYGTRLKTATILEPSTATVAAFGSADPETLARVEVKISDLKPYKSIVLQKGTELPILVAIPSLDATAAAKKLEVKAKERVTVGTTEAILIADKPEDIDTVVFGKTNIDFTLNADKKSITLKGAGLAAVTALATSRDLTVQYKDTDQTKVTVTIEVINSKVEMVNKP